MIETTSEILKSWTKIIEQWEKNWKYWQFKNKRTKSWFKNVRFERKKSKKSGLTSKELFEAGIVNVNKEKWCRILRKLVTFISLTKVPSWSIISWAKQLMKPDFSLVNSSDRYVPIYCSEKWDWHAKFKFQPRFLCSFLYKYH